ncbi:hypothetical protein PAMC26577_19835 [Caballeronia sordidicola]|uniref:Uncharacterized protein n=1 Tax=Caballeronia sordidicola TaxID=196367 RepID=A0A242MPT9_CABSO|nr:hypothetical protein PAMC26577_19835 [Caballeronia sordidicola]
MVTGPRREIPKSISFVERIAAKLPDLPNFRISIVRHHFMSEKRCNITVSNPSSRSDLLASKLKCELSKTHTLKPIR